MFREERKTNRSIDTKNKQIFALDCDLRYNVTVLLKFPEYKQKSENDLIPFFESWLDISSK